MPRDDEQVAVGVTAVARRIGRMVHAARTAQAMSLGDLGRASGLSKTILARIERGEGNPSVETLWRVSTALGLPLGALLGGEDGPRVQHIAGRSRPPLESDAGMRAWLVDAEGRDHRAELYELELAAGVDQHSAAHLPGTEEVVLALDGRLLAGPDGGEVRLAPGDAVRFAADTPHRYHAPEGARALCWMRYPGSGR